MTKHKSQASATIAACKKLSFLIIAASASYNSEKSILFDPPDQFEPLQIFNCLCLISKQSGKSLNRGGSVFSQNQSIFSLYLSSELTCPVFATNFNKTYQTSQTEQSPTCLFATYAFLDDIEDKIYPHSFCDRDEIYFDNNLITSDSEFLESIVKAKTECTIFKKSSPNFPICKPNQSGFISDITHDRPSESKVPNRYYTGLTQNDDYNGIKLYDCSEFPEYLMSEGKVSAYGTYHVKNLGSCKDSTSDYCNDWQDYMCPDGYKNKNAGHFTNTINDCTLCQVTVVCQDYGTNTTLCTYCYNCLAMTIDIYSKPAQPYEFLTANIGTGNFETSACAKPKYCEGATCSANEKVCSSGSYTTSCSGQHSLAGSTPVNAVKVGKNSVLCAAGKICPEENYSNLTTAAGKFCSFASTTTTNCLAGYYYLEGTVFQKDTPCSFCETSTTVANSSSGCTSCTYRQIFKQGSTASFKATTYCGTDNFLSIGGSLQRKQCPGNQCTSDGATCLVCPAGKFFTAGFQPINCNTGCLCSSSLYCCFLSPAGQITSDRATDAVFGKGLRSITGLKVVKACPTGYCSAGDAKTGCANGQVCAQRSSATVVIGTGTLQDQVNLFYKNLCQSGYICPAGVPRTLVVVCQYTKLDDSGVTASYFASIYSCAVESICSYNDVCADDTYYITAVASATYPKRANGSYCYQGQQILFEPGFYCNFITPEQASLHQLCPVCTYATFTGTSTIACTHSCFYYHTGRNKKRPNEIANIFGDTSLNNNYCPISSFDPVNCPIVTFSGGSRLQVVTECEKCKNGMYCSIAAVGQDGLLTCTAGSQCIESTTEASAASFCGIGYYSPIVNGVGTKQQFLCPAGQDVAGQSSFQPCELDNYCAFNQNTSGPFLNVVGQQGSCQVFTERFYCPFERMSVPIACTDYYFCQISCITPVLSADDYICDITITTTQIQQTPCPVRFYCIQGKKFQCYTEYLRIASAVIPNPIDGTTVKIFDQGYWCINSIDQVACSTGNYQPQYIAQAVGMCSTCSSGTVVDFQKKLVEVCLLESHVLNQIHYDSSNHKNFRKEPQKVCAMIIVLIVFSRRYIRSIIEFLNRCLRMRQTAKTMFKLVFATSKALHCTIKRCCKRLNIESEFTDDQDEFKTSKQSAHHLFKLVKTQHKDPRQSVSLVRYGVLLIMFLFTHTNAQTCFNDKLPSFIMDADQSNEYVWQTVIISKDDRYLYKGGYVKITSTTQTAFPGAPIGSQALAGKFDTLTNTFIWVKIFVDENFSSPIISAIAINYNEETLVLAGTSTDAKKSFYFFVVPQSGLYKYRSFTVTHGQDFHFLTSQSILLAGASRLYCTGISMAFTYVAGSQQYTLECQNIGQTCIGTDNSLTLDAIQYLVVDYATQTVLWHKIANSTSQFGAGSVASLIDVNRTASVNGQEHVIMGGGFSTDTTTLWKASLMSINPITGQLDLVQGLQPTTGGSGFVIPTASDYPIIVHMDLYQTATKWIIFTLTQSRLLSTTGWARKQLYLCQIDFSSASYTAVTSTICKDHHSTNLLKNYGTGIKYDPIAEKLHYFFHSSNLAVITTSNVQYRKLNLVTGALQNLVGPYNSFVSSAGVFTDKPLVTLSNGYQVFPGYFVGYQKSFSSINFPTAPTALTFTKNAAVTYPYDKAETCSNEALDTIGTSTITSLTNTVSSFSNLVVGDQLNQVAVQRFYKTIDLQFSSLATDNLCGSSSYTPVSVIPGSFHNVNLYIGSQILYQCPFTLNTLNVTCTDSNKQIYSIDESSITGTKTNIFTADVLNSKILVQILDSAVLPQSQTITVTSTTPSGTSGSFNYIVNLLCGPAPSGFDPCTDTTETPTCLTAIDPISVYKSAAPLNVTYLLGSAVNNVAVVLPFSLTASCTYCQSTDIVYLMIVTPLTTGQSTLFIVFDSTNMVIDWTSTNYLNSGEFEITIKGTINRVTQVFDTFTFKINVVVPTCAQFFDDPTIMPPIISGTSPGAFSYILDTTTSQDKLNVAQIQVDQFKIDSMFCDNNDIEYQMIVRSNDASNSNWFQFNQTTMIVDWSTSNINQVGNYIVRIEGCLKSLINQVCGAIEFTVQIFQCQILPVQKLTYQYILGSGEKSFLMSIYKSSPLSCLKTKWPLGPNILIESQDISNDTYSFSKGKLHLNLNQTSIKFLVFIVKATFDDQIIESRINFQIFEQANQSTDAQASSNQSIFNYYPKEVINTTVNKKIVEPKIIYISKVGPGKLIIKFSEPIFVPMSYERLQLDLNEIFQSAVSIKLHRKPNTNITENFSYSFTKVINDSMYFDIEYPEQTLSTDSLIIEFPIPAYLLSNKTSLPLVSTSTEISNVIPLQFKSEGQLKTAEAISGSLQKVLISTLVLMIIGQFAGKLLIKFMWDRVLSLQITLALYQYNKESYPSNVAMVLDSIQSIYAMDALPKSEILSWIFENQSSLNLEQNGLIYGMCLFGTLLVATLLAIVVLFIIKKATTNCCLRLRQLIDKIINMLCWNFVIKTIQAGFIQYAISSIKSIYTRETQTEIVAGSIILLFMVLFVIINFLFTVRKPARTLSRQDSKDKFGSMYTGLNIHSKAALFQSTLFYFIRILFALSIVTLPFFAQLLITLLMICGQICYILKYKPYIIKYDLCPEQQNLQLFNQTCLYLQILVSFVFTNQNYQQSFMMGWVFNGILCVNVLFNMFLLLFTIFEFRYHQLIYQLTLKNRIKQQQIEIHDQIQIRNVQEQIAILNLIKKDNDYIRNECGKIDWIGMAQREFYYRKKNGLIRQRYIRPKARAGVRFNLTNLDPRKIDQLLKPDDIQNNELALESIDEESDEEKQTVRMKKLRRDIRQPQIEVEQKIAKKDKPVQIETRIMEPEYMQSGLFSQTEDEELKQNLDDFFKQLEKEKNKNYERYLREKNTQIYLHVPKLNPNLNEQRTVTFGVEQQEDYGMNYDEDYDRRIKEEEKQWQRKWLGLD